MLKLNLITALRNLIKNKVVSGINVFGLTVGLTCAVFAILYANHELSYEECHSKADRICRVYTFGDFGIMQKIPNTFGAIPNDLKNNIPEVALSAKTNEISITAFLNNKAVNENNILVAENTLYDILDFEFVYGEKTSDPGSIAINETMAKKYFGKTNAIGENLKTNIWGRKLEYTVSGVYKDFPSNTHVKARAILPFNLARKLGWQTDNYNSADFEVYTLLNNNVDYKKVNQKIVQTIKPDIPIKNLKFALVPIKRMHLHDNMRQNTKTNLYLLLFGGLLSLLLTLFNYVNTSTVLFTSRTKEIGIRKSAGGNKIHIFSQFLTETWISVTVSFIVSLLLFSMLRTHFNQMLDVNIALIPSIKIILLISAIYLFTIITAGLYPSIKSVRVKAIQLINEKAKFSHRKSRLGAVLIGAQFVTAILVLQFILISQKQNRYMWQQDVIKFNADNVICVSGYEWGNLNTVKENLLKSPTIKSVSWGSFIPASGGNMTSDWKKPGNKEMVSVLRCEKDYLRVFQIDLIQGNFFSKSSKQQNKVAINPLTAKSLNYNEPIGKQVMLHGRQYEIMGITDDYLSVPPIFDKSPLILQQAGDKENYLTIRINPEARAQAHEYITQTLTTANPNYPVELKYYDDIAGEYGKSFINTAVFINIFSGIIIFNAMLGLFALSLFAAGQRTKEIGVYKVCGASVLSVFFKLSKGFLTRLLWALIITMPLTFLMGKAYLSTFTVQTELGAGVFILGILLSTIMVLISTGWKVFFAARRNPVEALRYE